MKKSEICIVGKGLMHSMLVEAATVHVIVAQAEGDVPNHFILSFSDFPNQSYIYIPINSYQIGVF